MVKLREEFAHDPESLRDALSAWDAAHGKAFQQLGVELAQEAARHSAPARSESSLPPSSGTLLSALPADAEAVERQAARLQDRLNALYAAHPHPAARHPDSPATEEELIAWRNDMISLTQPLEEEMRSLQSRLAEIEQRRLAEEIQRLLPTP